MKDCHAYWNGDVLSAKEMYSQVIERDKRDRSIQLSTDTIQSRCADYEVFRNQHHISSTIIHRQQNTMLISLAIYLIHSFRHLRKLFFDEISPSKSQLRLRKR